MKRYINKIVLVGIMATCLFSCNKKPDGPINPDPTPTPTPEPVEETIFDSLAPGKNKTYPKLEEFTPTLFKKDTFKKIREIKLIDGADYITYSFNLNNDHKVIANIIDVDLTKAKIDTNYAKSGIDTAYGQLIDYQNSSNKKDENGDKGIDLNTFFNLASINLTQFYKNVDEQNKKLTSDSKTKIITLADI